MAVKKYRMQIVHKRTTTVYDVEVEAECKELARTKSFACDRPRDDAWTEDIAIQSIRQLGEPWVYGWSGDSPTNASLGRPDGYQEKRPQELLIFERSPGNRFTAEEVELLKQRAEKAVGPVYGSWNGAGCTSLTIRMKEPYDRLTDEQLAALMAPLPPEMARE